MWAHSGEAQRAEAAAHYSGSLCALRLAAVHPEIARSDRNRLGSEIVATCTKCADQEGRRAPLPACRAASEARRVWNSTGDPACFCRLVPENIVNSSDEAWRNAALNLFSAL